MLLAGSLFVFYGCTKTGSQGPQGPAGQNGNADVIGTQPFTSAAWSFVSANNDFEATYTDADITAAVADSGLVIMYIQYTDGSWRNLPDILNGTEFSFGFYQGGFVIHYFDVDGSAPTMPSSETFRTVIVPSSVRKANPGTKWNNYNETVSVLNGQPAAIY